MSGASWRDASGCDVPQVGMSSHIGRSVIDERARTWSRRFATALRCGSLAGVTAAISRGARIKGDPYSRARIMAPATIRSPPTPRTKVSLSPRKSAANKMTKATLNLSMGATRTASPSWRARK